MKALRDRSIEQELAYWVDGFAGMDDVPDMVAFFGLPRDRG